MKLLFIVVVFIKLFGLLKIVLKRRKTMFFNSSLKMENGLLKLLESLFAIRHFYKVCGVTFQIIQTSLQFWEVHKNDNCALCWNWF